jgi:hypothetical protein
MNEIKKQIGVKYMFESHVILNSLALRNIFQKSEDSRY